MLPLTYRARVYDRYVSGRPESNTPTHLGDLKPRRAYLNKLIRMHFPPERGATIIDLGCGYGALVHFARGAGYGRIVGVDHAAEQVAAAKRLGIEGVFHGDVVGALRGCSDASHDAVVALDVIEHFTKDEAIALADEVLRVLKPGGRWILHVPNGAGLFGARVLYGDFTHEYAYTRQSLGQLATAAGFSEVRCFEDAPVPHGVKSAMRWLLWQGIRGALRFYLAVETGAGGRDVILTQNLLAVAVK